MKEKDQSGASTPTVPKIKLRAPAAPKITLRKPLLGAEIPSSPSSNAPSITLASARTKTVLHVKPSRVHGDGWDSEDPDREDDPLIEDGIILRMLPDANLDLLRSAADSGDLSAVSIFWKDKRRAIVKIHGEMYAAKLVELPTVIDVHKTLDKKNMFKTIDVCQMLLVVKRIYNEREIMDLHVDKEFGETFPDGITPPMVNSKYRFTKKYEQRVIQNIEDEVDKLLKLDAEAESSTYEFINPDDDNNITLESIIESKIKNKLSKKEKKKRRRERAMNEMTPAAQIASAMQIPTQNTDAMDKLDEELDKLMGDVDLELGQEDEEDDDDDEEDGRTTQNGEDDDEEEEESDDDDDIVPENAEIPINSEGPGTEMSSEDEDEDDEDDYLFNDGNPDGPREEVDETKRHNAILADEIKELEGIIEQKNNDLTKIVNPIMKNRINDVIGKLVQELEMKKKQIIETKEDEVDSANTLKRNEEEDNEGDNEEEEEEEEDEIMEEEEEPEELVHDDDPMDVDSIGQLHIPLQQQQQELPIDFDDEAIRRDIDSITNSHLPNLDEDEDEDFGDLF